MGPAQQDKSKPRDMYDPKGSGVHDELVGIWKDTSFIAPARSLKNNAAFGLNVIGSLFSAVTGAVKAAGKPGRTQTFPQAVEENRLSDEDLVDRHNSAVTAAMGVGLVGVVCFLVSALYCFNTDILSAMMLSACLGFACMVTAVRALYDAFRIRNRTMGHLRYFLMTPSQWIPGYMMKPDAQNDESKKNSDEHKPDVAAR